MSLEQRILSELISLWLEGYNPVPKDGMRGLQLMRQQDKIEPTLARIMQAIEEEKKQYHEEQCDKCTVAEQYRTYMSKRR